MKINEIVETLLDTIEAIQSDSKAEKLETFKQLLYAIYSLNRYVNVKYGGKRK